MIGEKTGKEEFSLLIEKLKKHLEEILIEEGSADRVNFSSRLAAERTDRNTVDILK